MQSTWNSIWFDFLDFVDNYYLDIIAKNVYNKMVDLSGQSLSNRNYGMNY